MMKFLLSFLLIFTLSSCSMQEIQFPNTANMLFRVEDRDMDKAKTIEYRVFDNGLVLETVMFIGENNFTDFSSMISNKQTFSTEFKMLDEPGLAKANAFLQDLEKLEYANTFPWKEDHEQKGNVVKIEFVTMVDMECFDAGAPPPQEDSPYPEPPMEKCMPIKAPKTYLYYTGHNDSPDLFQDIVDFVKR